MEYIASISYGKDSLYMLELIHQHNLPLTRIIHAEVMATKEISADCDAMNAFKIRADKIIYEKYSMLVEKIYSDHSYDDYFYKVRGPRALEKNRGKIYGFPMLFGSWCNNILKVGPLKKYISKNCIQYIGYAIDEKKHARKIKIQKYKNKELNNNEIYPMVDYNATEEDALKWCADNNLLSPIYNESARGGCWFCHYQSLEQLRLLRKNHPDKWAMMLKWDKDSPVSFKPNNVTVHDLDKRFGYEDAQISMFDKRGDNNG